ncbi:dynein axonemal heavy chain 3-like isoform X2 [Petromyzon marinus]|uniref:dynein axonemal heavy chain 3-like isoform X2 n=1 Tax=Petromyzon marinus TaxID=7757 RepID=UPI003F6F7AD8
MSSLEKVSPNRHGSRPHAATQLPPLGLPQIEWHERPRILQRGSWTLAVPSKEEQFFRSVSDSIGNNYSPTARDLSTHGIYKLLNTPEPAALRRSGEPGERSRLPLRARAPGGAGLSERARGTGRRSGALPSLSLGSSDAATQGSSGEPDLRSDGESGAWGRGVGRPHADAAQAASGQRRGPQLDGGTWQMQAHHPGLSALDKRSLLGAWGGDGGGGDGGMVIARGHSLPSPESPRLDSCAGRSQGRAGLPLAAPSDGARPWQGCVEEEEDEDRGPRHDQATVAALSVAFPPAAFSTRGLSRPSTPPSPLLCRYHGLIETAIDQQMLSPLCPEWMKGSLSLLPVPLMLCWKDKLHELTKEVSDEYERATKKAVLDYVLLDRREQARLGLAALPPKPSNSAGRERFPWHDAVGRARDALSGRLYATHPVVTAVLDNFQRRYAGFRLVDVPALRNSMPLTLPALEEHVRRCSRERADALCCSWLVESRDSVSRTRDAVEAWMPQDDEVLRTKRMDHLFGSVATLMSNLLRSIVAESLCDLVAVFEELSPGNDYSGEYPRGELGLPTKPLPIILFMEPVEAEGPLALGGSAAGEGPPLPGVTFGPSLAEVAATLDRLVEHVVTSVQAMPRLEHQLFQATDAQEVKFIGAVQIHDEIVVRAKARIRVVLENNSPGPSRYRSVYGHFAYLLNGGAGARAQALTSREPPNLVASAREIQRLRSLAGAASSLPTAVPLRLFLLDCSTLNQWLTERARKLAAVIGGHAASASERFNREVCARYEAVVERATGLAESTYGLVQLQEYVDSLHTGELQNLKERLETAADNLLFLMDYTYLSKEDLILNGNTFSWPVRILPIIRNSELRLQKQHDAAVSGLAQRRAELERRVAAVASAVRDFARRDRLAEAAAHLARLDDVGRQVRALLEEKSLINREEELLGTGTGSSYPQILELEQAKEPYERLWRAAVALQSLADGCLGGPIHLVNAEQVADEVQTLWKTSYRLTKVFNHPEMHGPMRVATAIKARLEKFKINMPLITVLCTPGIKERHWEMMSVKAGVPLPAREETCLQEVLSLGLERQLEALASVSNLARKEHTLEEALAKMGRDWEPVRLTLVPYKDTGTTILASVDDVQVLLDDHMVKTTTIKGSPFIAPFEKELTAWEAKLRLLNDILESWLRVQAAWLYLEPIFGSADIRSQIPVEGKMFETVDANWQNIMGLAKADTRVMAVVAQEGVLDKLREAESLLEDIQKGLNHYLETKRLFFPRFFFLSNDELLEILSETREPQRVQPHLKKCFEGIACLTFNADKEITHMESAEGERVALVERIVPADARGLVEKWLLQVERAMKASLQEVMAQAVAAYPVSPRAQWVLSWPGQVVLAGSCIHWTSDVSEAMERPGGLLAYLEQSGKQIEEVVGMVRGKLSKMARITLGALITIDVHARDVVARLAEGGVSGITEFPWIAQLRYYWEVGGARVCMVTTGVPYGYEYLGNTGRLVITPLTDRCYRTLMGALLLNLGGAPEGPAGTGKTETCKDLAKAVAKQCVVFNCSDGLDYRAMGKFFKGLAQCGAWACFDEFNRIELEVLSVVAQQIQTIQRAVAERLHSFVFEGTEITLDSSCSIFITMNPGYAGRAELPDNLKVLFRTVAMMVPDYTLIAEISLFSMGFVNARSLAAKVVATYRLCSEQLSSQHHYDYGMRAVKSVLTAAGNLKLKFPEESEEVLVLRSITDVNLPKFLSHDIALFNSIISDLFPGVDPPTPDHGDLEVAIRDVIAQQRLEPAPWFITKIIQVYEMMLVRHGFMLVGGPLGGKTSALKALAGALGELERRGLMGERRVDFIIINPKALSMAQLYGSFDPISHEWTDGVLATAFRAHASSVTGERKWCVFDGPVDAEWIENMNTVLDDNKKLCLMSGEIIQMTPHQNMIFEVLDLEQASPATVSRCGMIYMEPTDLGWQPLVQSWLRTELPAALSQQHRATVKLLFEWLLPACLEYGEKQCRAVVKTSRMHVTASLLSLYSCLLEDLKLQDGESRTGEEEEEEEEEEDGVEEQGGAMKGSRMPVGRRGTAAAAAAAARLAEERTALLTAHFLFAVVWAVGGVLDRPSKERFSEFFRKLCEQDPRYPCPALLRLQRALLMPKTSSVFGFVYRQQQASSWAWSPWKDLVLPFHVGDQLEPSEVLVGTAETARLGFFLETVPRRGRPLLLVGPPGTGKTWGTRAFLRALPSESHVACELAFSAHTSAVHTQDSILAKLERRKKDIYGPLLGKRMIVFVDDLNMPAKGQYGAQPPIELLRQWIDHGYWFDRQTGGEVHLQDTAVVAAMAPVGGGRHEVTPRLLRHFNVLAIDAFSEDTVKGIFQPIADWHFSRGFETSLKRFARVLVWATTEVYTAAVQSFLPTPSKSHYIFSLRDFARVVQGLMLVKASCVPLGDDGARKLMRLWVHEVYRVFSDRLVDASDHQLFFTIIKNVVQTQFKERMSSLFANLMRGRELGHSDMRGLFFGDFMGAKSVDGRKRDYDEIADVERLKKVVEKCLQEYNAASKAPMDLVLFQFAIEHVSRISRILNMPNGHALLVGIGGSGRQSATRLAAFLAELELSQVSGQKSYAVAEWREDLKRLLRRAGEEGVPTVFLLADHQIKDESFLEDVGMILNTGDIPNLFESDERVHIIEKMQQLVQAENAQEARSPLLAYASFVRRVRQNLHVVLAFSPIGDAFRDRLRSFPSLISCCTIDWFQAWPEDALEKVANHFLDDVEMSQEVRDEAVVMCKHFHQSVRALSKRFYESLQRRTYVTPTSYLELIKTFKSLLERKRLELLTQKNRYVVGLEKLDFAATQIALMKQELTELEPQLIERSKETEELVNIIADETLEVEAAKAVVESEEATANAAAQAAKAIKDECLEKLSIATPALNAAIAALDTLKSSDITLVKTMQNPPSGVRLTLAAICVLKGIKPEKKTDANGKTVDDYWPSSKKMLGDMKFLESLKEFDKDNIPPKVIAQVRRDYIGNPEFQPNVIRNVSSACEGLCSWVRATEVYDKVAKIVAPKRARLVEAEAELALQMEQLEVKREELREVSAKLGALQDRLALRLADKQQLEDSIQLTRLKLVRAEKLMSGLGGEKERWAELATVLHSTYQNIVGDVLLSSGIVAYLGPFTPEFRQEILREWYAMCREKSIPVSHGFSLAATLGDPVRIMEWELHGLPRDIFSVENAIIVTSAQRWPLMIDPQVQANKWIKNMERASKLHVCKLADSDYARTLSNCVQFGYPVLLENVPEELDPMLDPILLRQTFRQGGVECVRLGDAVVQYSGDFRLYMTTRLRNPHFLPQVSVKVTLLNFMITPRGLEDQLLSIVAAREKPELEEAKNQLYLEGAHNRKQLKELEDQILEVLSTSQGNILEDETAIAILSSSRQLSSEIADKQEVTVRTEKQIDETRNGYKPVASHSSVLFFVISNLAHVDPMYQYSLAWFIGQYVQSIASSRPSSVLHERTEALNSHFTCSIYTNVCRSLFEKDKLLFSFLLCVGLARSRGRVSDADWRFLLTGGVALPSPSSNPAPALLDNRSWAELARCSDLPGFSGLAGHFCDNLDEWKAITNSPTPHEAHLPEPWGSRLTRFQRLLILRCIRPDKVIPAVQQYIAEEMGERYIEPPPFDLAHSFRDSSRVTPLVFVLSPGADPMALLMHFADERGMGGSNIETISLGQGQGPIAVRMIEKAASEGTWVVLQNCHLAASWLSELERICEDRLLDPDRTRSEFRLWLTSYPSTRFPVSVLENGVKMTNESPIGLRANLLRSFLNDPISDPAFFNGCNKPTPWKKLLFGLCFFHALVQERRTFGSLGWNVSYEFNESDLRISARQVQMFLNEYEEVPLEALAYLTGECNYGGRVTDEHDRRLLLALLATFYCERTVRDDAYRFSPTGRYGAPPAGAAYECHLEHIKGLPLHAHPEVFGLHENASITKEQNETQRLFDGILKTLPRETSGGGKSSSDFVQELATDILSKIPPKFDIEEIKSKFPTSYSESMHTVLVQELVRFNGLTGTVRNSLRNVTRAVSGQALMSAELEDIYSSIILGKVPAMWSAKSYPSLKPLGSYVSDLLARLQFFTEWIEKGAPSVFWISGFFFTQSFLTGALQNFARKHKVPIDQLGFQYHITEHEKHVVERPDAGVYITGLFMEGGRWDREKRVIGESLQKILYDSLPVMWLKPVERSTAEETSTYACPVYKTSARRGIVSTTGHSTNYVLTVKFPTDQPSNHWVTRGVACLCQLDY